MNNEQAANVTIQGFEFLVQQCAMIALLPLEDWLKGLNFSESVAPVLDPTLYREYSYSEKAAFIKELITAAIPVKVAVEKMQARISTTEKKQ
jgi:hypothetical protein